MSDALYDLLGIDEKALVDPAEIKEIKRVLDLIKVEAAKIARKHDTADTMQVLAALLIQVKAFTEIADPQMARKVINARNAGEKISFGTGVVDPELAAKAAKADELQKQLDDIQATAASTTTTTKALGGSGTDPDTLKAKFAQIVDANPDGAAQVLQIVEQFANVPEDERTMRSVLALKIVNGVDGYGLVDFEGARIPKLLADAYAQKRIAETENVGLKQQLDPKVKDSVGDKAANWDFNIDPNNDGYAGKLKKALADLAAVQKVDRAKVNTLLDSALAELEKVKGGVFGLGDVPKPVADAKVKIADVKREF